MSLAIAALILLQPAPLYSVQNPVRGLWLACGIYAIAASAIAFTEREDARSIIQLGGSLAIVQLLDPMGPLIVAALLPGLFGLNRKGFPVAQSAGLYALVLFMPVVTALALAYLSRTHHLDIPVLVLNSTPALAKEGALHIAGDFVPLLIAAPVLLRGFLAERKWTPPNVSIALVAFAISLAAIVSGVLGTSRRISVLAAAATPLPLIAISRWPQSHLRARDALAAAAVTTALAWSAVL